MDKDIAKALEVLNSRNPYSSLLSKSSLSNVDRWFSTGSYALNGILSGKFKNGGLASGRMTMLYGESMTMKTFLVLKILADAQRQGVTPVIFDTESAIDPETAERCGVDLSKCQYIPVFSIEELRNSIYAFLTYVKENKLEGKFIIAIDSLGNLQSQLETNRMEKDSSSADMGNRARAIKSLLITCTQLSALTKTAIICTNHLYENPGDLHPTLIKSMPGGKATVYLPSVSVQLMRKPVKQDAVKQDVGELAANQKNYVGVIVRALTAKNRFVKQYLETELFISFAKGTDPYHGLLDIAVGLGVIEQTGSTYAFNGEKIGYAKSFIENADFWENKIIPILEEKVKTEWSYSTQQDTELKKLEKEADLEVVE
jgi:recombination protein RecA